MKMVGVPNWGHVTGRFLLGICHMVKGSTLSETTGGNISIQMRKNLCQRWATFHISPTTKKKLFIFQDQVFLYDLTKLPAMVLCLVESPVRFL